MIRKKEHEKLDRSNLKLVYDKYSTEKITIKEGCSLLNIAYNSARFKKILEEYFNNEEFRTRKRKELRSTPVTSIEKKLIIEAFLNNEPLERISETTFRSTGVIKRILEQYNVPLERTGKTYFSSVFIESSGGEFKKGDLVFACRYARPCTITRVMEETKDGAVYALQFHGEDRFSAYQPDYELIDLTAAQKEFDIKLYDLGKEEVNQLLYEAVKKSNDQI